MLEDMLLIDTDVSDTRTGIQATPSHTGLLIPTSYDMRPNMNMNIHKLIFDICQIYVCIYLFCLIYIKSDDNQIKVNLLLDNVQCNIIV